MKLHVLLADAAQVESGKLSALGIGWTFIPTPAPAFSLVVLLEIEWHERAPRYQVFCQLLRGNGEPAMVHAPEGDQPFQVQFEASLDVNPAAPDGAELRLPMVLNFPPGLPIAPGRYRWRAGVLGFDSVVADQQFDVIEPEGVTEPQEFSEVGDRSPTSR